MEKYIGPFFATIFLSYFVYFFGKEGMSGIFKHRMHKLRWTALLGSEGDLGYKVYDKENDEWIDSDQKIIKGTSAQITGVIYIIICTSSIVALTLGVIPHFFE